MGYFKISADTLKLLPYDPYRRLEIQFSSVLVEKKMLLVCSVLPWIVPVSDKS